MIGMLWFDAAQVPLQKKVEKALQYYSEKHALSAKVCLVNRMDAIDEDLNAISKATGLTVRVDTYIAPNTLLIGQDTPMEILK